jgi:hypothetical protein
MTTKIWLVLLLGLVVYAPPAPANAAPADSAGGLRNLTGLPAYPNLNNAVMDGVYRTDTLGHWCMRFWSDTTDSLAAVESWYRKNLYRASETDLSHDTTYAIYSSLNGIKLAMGIDYVAVYRASRQSPTTIDLYRCSPRN